MSDIYEQVISKKNEIIAAKDDQEAVAEKMSDLITMLMDNFTGDFTQEEVTRIFHASEDDDLRVSEGALGIKCVNTMDMETLKSLVVAVVPIAVVRYLLSVERIVFDTKKCSSMNRFTEAYSNVILKA